jgi:hypothetical protein
MLDDQQLKEARLRAEKAVADMADGELKLKAFEVILSQLVAGRVNRPSASEARSDVAPRRPSSGSQPRSLSERILALQADDFFKAPQTIGRVRDGLSVRGWHYPLTTLSGALQGLVQKRRLRRERVRDNHKTLWCYFNP